MRRTLALAAILAALAAATPAPANAAVDPGRIARALERSPIYVDPSLDDALKPADRRQLLRAIEDAPDPVYVVLVPLVQGDRFGGEPESLLAVISGRLKRPGIYVTVDGNNLAERAVGVDEDRAFQASIVGDSAAEFDDPPAVRLEGFLQALSDPRLAERYERESEELGKIRTPPPSDDEEPNTDGGIAWAPIAGVGAVLAMLAAGLVVVRRRRRAQYTPDIPPVLPNRVFEHARASAERELRDTVQRELVALADALDETSAPESDEGQEAYQRALDGYGAARKTLDEATGPPDLAGALVLIDRGRAALAAAQAHAAGAQPPTPQPICFFNPLHGHAAGPVRWGDDSLKVPACAECAAALRGGKTPDVLHDDGRPYFEGDGLWAKTGYGAFADDLAERVLRGERG